MDFFNIVNSRRSVRSFKSDAVPRTVLEKIAAAGQEAPSGCNVQGKQFIIVDDPDVMARMRELSPALNSAPAAVVLAIEPEETKFGPFWVQDASAAMENMLLAAVALGYAGCWVEGAIRRCEDDLREILGVPEHLRVWSLTPVGIPETIPDRPTKPTPDEVTHLNRFGQS
ncbi:MAG: nitroreductase family protein [Planctomycetota bacterium]